MKTRVELILCLGEREREMKKRYVNRGYAGGIGSVVQYGRVRQQSLMCTLRYVFDICA